MEKLCIARDELGPLQGLLAEVAARYASAEDPDFLLASPLLAHELPRRLRAALLDFRLTEPDSALLVISGLPIDDEKIGSTPEHWHRPAERRSPSLEEEIFLVLASSLLGECIGWRTQQGGRVIHDVMPIRGLEQEQIGNGSEQTIWWHTEDAFHPLHGDYLAMMCLRNPDRVPTTFASIARLGLDDDDWQALFEPHFTILPDNSHRPENAAQPAAAGQGPAQVYGRIGEMQRQPEKIALLSGDPRSPYIRIDPFFMPPPEDARARRALAALTAALDARLGDIVQEPGDLCFIDNRKAVHGRRAFKASYDGRDRWLKRTNITRDLRRSRAARGTATSRIVQ